ncbi:uncharacterized protein L969DRAFT_105184 [Mixia osmundae IAM 14324]|uniref:Mitochondrial presequence protease n=1 Tax=Mixia osmundae (strain CBS 9802 / IAM 14324 / JCM 22182 / KY 12970) TaxID=764103 RepID=G7DUX2_MIXOS|nr:uncharacterized protein L969DRAFT_105184 [Mixia osmundae IAM 14324]KEI37401.1 hypothetical protein L969DRAFT_105184 [Mixia osmundae IAM 14324]GAA94382.1 hypothetical protein E5Q_01033 [Mixia osmundae IAM 14324]
MGDTLKDAPEFFEHDVGSSLISRTEQLGTFRELGPPDLCHVVKTTGRSGSKDLGSFHYVSGVTATSSASLAAYLNSLTYTIDGVPSWLGGKSRSDWKIKTGCYCCFNAFSRVDVRVEVKIPGGVDAYVIDLRGERHDPTPQIWTEVYLSSILRAILYADDPAYRLAGYKKLDPIRDIEDEHRFVAAAEQCFSQGWLLGSDPEIQVATSTSNHLTSAIMKYFGDSYRWEPAINLFEKLVVRDGEVASLLAKAYISMDEEIKGIQVLHRALQDHPQSYPLLHVQTDFLRSKGEHAWALRLATKAVNCAPSEYVTWAKLTDVHMDLKQWKEALLTLNSCPMFTYNDRDLHRMGTPARTHLPIKQFIADSDILDDDDDNNEADIALLRLPAPSLKGTFAHAYALLSRLVSVIGWDELLKCRSEVFVMEAEYAEHRAQQTGPRRGSAALLNGSTADSIAGSEEADDDASTHGLKMSDTADTSLAAPDIPDISVSSDLEDHSVDAVRKGSAGELSGQADGITPPVQAVHDDKTDRSDAADTFAQDASPIAGSSFQNKRLCERWLDNLFMVLYEDLRVYTIWRAELAHFKAQQLTYRKTGTEWEILGELAQRLHHKEEAKEAYERATQHKFSAKAWTKLLEFYADERDVPRSLAAVVRLATYQHRWYMEMSYPTTVAQQLIKLIRSEGVSKLSYSLVSMNLQPQILALCQGYFRYASTFRVEGAVVGFASQCMLRLVNRRLGIAKRSPLQTYRPARGPRRSMATALSYDAPKTLGNFDLTNGPLDLRQELGRDIKLSKWVSRKSGLRVVHVDVEGPLVQGYLTVATEIHDDSGCPHTLEHLVFMGSERFPYKGILDSLANRSNGNGTNAWTDTTHTAYTASTAGSDGFLRLLPIYLDHVLYPTLTDSGFTTEVYHLNGKGEDAGVVYSEMQGRENGSGDLMSLKLQRALYPKGSGYRSETGGLMEALRILTIDQIRDYHHSYYVPHNLVLIITGKVAPTELLQTLQDTIEPSIEKHGQAQGVRPPGFKRPWLETTSKGGAVLDSTRSEEISFPEQDESSGEVLLSWLGPPRDDFLSEKALDILSTYLSDSPVSPIYRDLVEIEEPLATDLGFYVSDQEKHVLNVYATSVPTEKLNTVKDKVIEVFRRVVESGIDMERMAMLLKRDRIKILSSLEKDASEIFASSVISDFMFGSMNGKDLERSLKERERFETLQTWSAEQWAELLQNYYIDGACLSIVGKPSATLAEKLEKETSARLEETRAKYGEKGLAELAEKLEAAQKENDKEIPKEILSDYKIPDVKSIRWIDVQTARASGLSPPLGSAARNVQDYIERDNVKLPYFVQYDHVDSNFVEINVGLFPTHIPAHLRSLAPIYLSSFFSLPVTREDGTKLSFEDVVKELDRETVSYDISLGTSMSEIFELTIKAERSKYATVIAWINDLLFGSDFDINRLKITASKLLQSLPSEKRDGETIVSALYLRATSDADKSTRRTLNVLDRSESISTLLKRLHDEPEKVQADLDEFRTALTAPGSMRIGVSGNILGIEKPAAAWTEHFAQFSAQDQEPSKQARTVNGGSPRSSQVAALDPVLSGRDVLSKLGRQPAKKAFLMSMPSIESSFAWHAAKAPTDLNHPDIPALRVACAILNAMESYLWKFIRGAGLAYGASIRLDVERGFVIFRVYKSPDSSKAYLEAKRVMSKLVKGEIELDELTLESAKSSMAYSVASRESSVSDAAAVSFINQALRGLPQDQERELLRRAGEVTVKQTLAALDKYILPIFNADSSIAAIASAKSKADDIATALEKEGFSVERTTLELSAAEEDGSSGSDSGSESSA